MKQSSIHPSAYIFFRYTRIMEKVPVGGLYTWLLWSSLPCFFTFCHSAILISRYLLPAGRVRSAWPAGPKVTLRFPRLYVCIYVCASALITPAI